MPEYAENAQLVLDLAKKEMARLAYTHSILYLQWVQSLAEREDLSEKIDAFVGGFGRLQDHIGDKLIPRFAALLGESPKSLLDVLAFAEKCNWVTNAEAFIGARKLRNLLVQLAKAVEQDHQLAQYHVGRMYLKGYGTEVNLVQALKWLSKAAEQGCLEAQAVIDFEFTDPATVFKA